MLQINNIKFSDYGLPFSVKIPSSGSLLASTSYTNEIPYPDLIRLMIILKLEIHRYFTASEPNIFVNCGSAFWKLASAVAAFS